jgi:hypothetical protein
MKKPRHEGKKSALKSVQIKAERKAGKNHPREVSE